MLRSGISVNLAPEKAILVLVCLCQFIELLLPLPLPLPPPPTSLTRESCCWEFGGDDDDKILRTGYFLRGTYPDSRLKGSLYPDSRTRVESRAYSIRIIPVSFKIKNWIGMKVMFVNFVFCDLRLNFSK